MGLLGYFVYRSLSLLLGQRFIGFLRFNLLRLTSPYFSAFGFLRFILLKLTSPIAGSVLLLDFSAYIYSAYWISPLLFTLADFSDCWISAIIGFLRL